MPGDRRFKVVWVSPCGSQMSREEGWSNLFAGRRSGPFGHFRPFGAAGKS